MAIPIPTTSTSVVLGIGVAMQLHASAEGCTYSTSDSLSLVTWYLCNNKTMQTLLTGWTDWQFVASNFDWVMWLQHWLLQK